MNAMITQKFITADRGMIHPVLSLMGGQTRIRYSLELKVDS